MYTRDSNTSLQNHIHQQSLTNTKRHHLSQWYRLHETMIHNTQGYQIMIRYERKSWRCSLNWKSSVPILLEGICNWERDPKRPYTNKQTVQLVMIQRRWEKTVELLYCGILHRKTQHRSKTLSRRMCTQQKWNPCTIADSGVDYFTQKQIK